jgi:acetyltransferase-like isoleucine patch superfamily enzyme
MPFYINPKRLHAKRSPLQSIIFWIKFLLVKPLLALGFKNVDYYYVHGEGTGNSLLLGKNISTADAIFNISSGNIVVKENTIFAHQVYVLTGVHRFYKGKLAKLQDGAPREVPESGYDITIGAGCFIGSGVIILNSCTIGDNVIIGAGSVVTKNIPDNVFAAGIPARVINKLT